MRIAFLSDLHANMDALGVLADDIASADAVVCLGDFVGYYCQVNEVIDAVRGIGVRCVLGNHDHFLLHGCPPTVPPAVAWGIAYAARVITAENRAWLASLPLVWGGNIGGRAMLLAHGSPWRPLTDYLYPDSAALAGLSAFDFAVVALGQTHHALVRQEGEVCVLNPGSAGQSRDIPAHACMAMLDTETFAVERIARPYDPARTMARAREAGAGPWITKHLVAPPAVA